jgi:lysophospholipase L1-like esterase
MQPMRSLRRLGRILARIALAIAVLAAVVALAELALRRTVAMPAAMTGSPTAPKAALYGWAWEPNFRHWNVDPASGALFETVTNSGGWKDVQHATVKPPGAKRVLVLGDSVTWGVVPLEKLYTRQLEALLRRRGVAGAEVIAMAVAGWGTDQQLEALTLEGLAFAPDIVVLQFDGSDIVNLPAPNGFTAEDRPEWFKRFRYELDGDRLRRVELEPHSVMRWFERANRSVAGSALVQAWTSWLDERATPGVPSWKPQVPMSPSPLLDPGDPWFLYPDDHGSPELRESWRLFEALVLEMQRRSERAGARFVLWSVEEEGRFEQSLVTGRVRADPEGRHFVTKDGLARAVRREAPRERLASICERHGLRCVPNLRVYHRFRRGGHPNKAGNEAMALDLADALAPMLKGR